jgi:putative hydrolase of HD superfamily
MKSFAKFFIEIGRLRKIPRRGGILIGSKKPASVTDHLFRVALMAWLLAKEKKTGLNTKSILRIALVHDLCELYTGDLTPYDYDSLLPKDKKKWPQLFDKWPRIPKAEKGKIISQKHKDEDRAFEKLLKDLPKNIRQEVKNGWLEYEKGSSREARFVKQINRLETLLQALEYGREERIRVYDSWWVGSKERIDDPLLLKFMAGLSKEFALKKKKR